MTTKTDFKKPDTLENREIKITRVIDAPRDLVFEVWTDPEHIKHWWGPNGFTTTISQMNVKPGGLWELVLHGPDGTDYKNKSIYKEIIKPERIVLDHVSGPKFQMSIQFEAQGDKTLISIQMLFESADQLEKVIQEFKADEGLVQNVDRLASYLKGNIAGREIVTSRLLNAPRELVFEAWTKPEHIVNWWGPNGFTNTIHEMEVKPGGVWRFMMHGPNGVDFPNRISFIEVVKPERLTYWHDEDVDDGPNKFYVIVTFEAKGKKTNLTMRAILKSAEALAEAKKFGAIEGGKQTLEKLDAYLEKMA
jgi:uncharacterized protein YndB with AHSA1/START domain